MRREDELEGFKCFDHGDRDDTMLLPIQIRKHRQLKFTTLIIGGSKSGHRGYAPLHDRNFTLDKIQVCLNLYSLI